MVIDQAPLIKSALGIIEVMEMAARQNIVLQCSVESLFFPIGLRMSRPAMTNRNAQLDEPDRQCRNAVFMLGWASSRRAVIGVQAQR